MYCYTNFLYYSIASLEQGSLEAKASKLILFLQKNMLQLHSFKLGLRISVLALVCVG